MSIRTVFNIPRELRAKIDHHTKESNELRQQASDALARAHDLLEEACPIKAGDIVVRGKSSKSNVKRCVVTRVLFDFCEFSKKWEYELKGQPILKNGGYGTERNLYGWDEWTKEEDGKKQLGKGQEEV